MRTVRDAGPAARRARRRPARGRRPRSATTGSSSSGSSRARRHVEIQVLFDAPRRTASTSASATARSSAATRRSSRRRRRRPSMPASAHRLGDGRPALAARGRLRERRDVRVPARRPRRARLPRDEHAPPGRAPGHRARHRPRPRRRPAADRGRRAARRLDQRDRPTPPATRSRSASTPRTPRPASCRRPGGSRRSAGRPARASGSMPGSTMGDRVGGRFDPMLAKIIAWGPDRADGPRPAGRRARRDASSSASSTNLRFLRWLVRQPVVLDGAGADRHARPDLAARRLGRARPTIPDEAWHGRRDALAGRPGEPADPWAGGWRLNAAPTVRLDRRRTSEPIGRRSTAAAPATAPTVRRRPRRRHRPSSTSPAAASPFRLAPPPDVDARGPRGRGPRRGRRDRSGRGRRPDARRRPRRPRRGRASRSRPATRSSPSRR